MRCSQPMCYFVELENGLFLGEKSSRTKNIWMARRYGHLQGARAGLTYAERYREWPNAKIVSALDRMRQNGL